jgi:ubiquinone/menaquinone biosynthesis C-methylase UbiE
METTDKVFSGSIPEVYDRLLVPHFFAVYGQALAKRLAETAPTRILEIAAGTGAVTRAIVAELPPDAQLVVTDLNQPMLDRAASHHTGDGRITWQTADALSLPFEDSGFDAAACGFGVMFFPDKVKGLSETRRVLRPGGRFVFSVWDRLSENDFAAAVTDALAEVFPADPPRFMARVPHSYCDEAQIRADLEAAGFASVTVDRLDHRSRASSAREASVALCEGTPLRNEIEARDAGGLQRTTERVTDAFARRFGEGPIGGRLRALLVTAAAAE